MEILRELVAIASPSAVSNAPLIAYVERLLRGHGWVTRRVAYEDANGVEKINLIAVPEQHADALPKVELAFVCHTDTVPFRADWKGALRLEELDGALHGCGACDVKGSMACLLAAALAMDAKGLKKPVALVLTADEEIGCVGATKLLAAKAIAPRMAVICEPTSLHPATAGKGYGLAQVKVTGVEAHSALPANGVSAIAVAAQVVDAVVELERDKAEKEDEIFDPPCTTFNVGLIQGGTAKNIIPGECVMTVEWRPVPGEDAARGGQRLRALVHEIEARNPGSRIEVEVLRADMGFARAEGPQLGPMLAAMLGRGEKGISFGSEATRFANVAHEVVVIGPGDMRTAHSDRECVAVAELQEWTECVRKLMLGIERQVEDA